MRCHHRGCRNRPCVVRLWRSYLQMWLRTHWATPHSEEAYRVAVGRIMAAYRGE